MRQTRGVAIGIIAAAMLTATAVWTGWGPRARDSSAPERLHVAARLDRPVGGRPLDLAALAPGAALRWTAGAVAREWTPIATGSTPTYRSPSLSGTRPLAIVVELPAGRSGAAAAPVLLWSTGPTLSSGETTRNRRELRPAGDDALVLRADNLQPDGEPLAHLFLHVPAPSIADGIGSIAIVSTGDLPEGVPFGPVRMTLSAQTRDVFLHDAREPLTFAIDDDRTMVSLGVHNASPAPVAVRVRRMDAVTGAPLAEWDAPPGWSDFRAIIERSGSIAVEPANADAPLTWSVPLVLADDPAPAKPHIVLYVIDALRADALGAYGAGSGRSPAIDSLAARSVVFERAYAAASWTKPSIATLLTGLYPMTHGLGARFYSDALPTTVPTLPQLLAQDGYATAQFSANPFTGTLSQLDRGFDVSALTGFATEAPAERAPPARALHDRAAAWLAAHPRQRVFLYIHAVDTHPPFSVAGETPRLAYDASLAAIDAELGALGARLASLGLDPRNTLFVLTADHGEAFGEHGRRGHGQSVYEEEIRVPLLLSWPSRLPPSRISEPIHQVDVMPTLLAAAGLGGDGGWQGRSVWPAATPVRPSPVVATRLVFPEDSASTVADRDDAHALVDYPWKLIATGGLEPPSRVELYRLDRDPAERENLAAAEPARTRTLLTALQTFLAGQREARRRFLATHEQRIDTAATPSRALIDQLRSLGYVR